MMVERHHTGIRIAVLCLAFTLFSVVLVNILVFASGDTALDVGVPQNSTSPGDIVPIGQVGGMIYAFEVQGSYAYVGIGTKLVVWDVTNPSQPMLVGESGILAGVVRDIELSGTQAFVAVGQGGVHILDIDTPSTPTELGRFSTYGDVVGIEVSGDYAYVASVFDDFRIFNVSDPASPTEAGHYGGITVAEGLDVVGDYAYVAAGGDGLQIIDISTPASPTGQGTYASTYAREVIVSDSYAYLADGYGSPNFVVVNVSSPASPSQAGSYAAPGEGYDLALVGSTIYLATWDNGVRIIDVSTPTNPDEIGFYNTPGRAEGVAVAGGYAYIADTWDGAKVVDVSDPASPSLAYEYHSAGEAWDVVIDSTIAYLGDRNNGFYTIDISAPSNPAILSYYAQSWNASEVYLAVSDNTLFVTDRDQLYTFDVSNPASPTSIGAYPSLTDPKGIAIAGHYAYIADGESGLRVLDIQDPTGISQVGSVDTPGDLTDLVLSGNYAYLADASQGLRVVDISDPASPSETGYFVPDGYSAGVAVAGHYAYLSAGWNGLRIINVSSPGTPTEIGFYDEMVGHAVAATEESAYVVASQFAATLQQLDVTDPVSPTVTAEYELPLDANRMKISNDQLNIAAGSGGLMIFQIPEQVSLDEVRPHQGHSDWASAVNIYGENLDADATFDLISPAPELATTLEVTRVNSTHFVASIPAGLSAGSYDLQVSNPDGGQATLENAYQVLDPATDTLYAYSDELWTGPVTPIAYEDTQLGLVVHRAGGSDTLTDLMVDFYDGDPDSGGDLLGSGTIAVLPPDSFTSTSGITWTPSSEGYHEIYAQQVNAMSPFIVHRSVWVMPPALDLVPPTVDSVILNGGVTDVSTQNMEISISASDNEGGTGVGSIYIIEFDWNPNMSEWVPVKESGWLNYQGTPMSHSWTLNWAPGVKNILVWAADRSGNISPSGHVSWMNFIPPAISINQGQLQMFSYWLTADQSFSAQTTPSSGDPDLYLGNSSGWIAHSINTGTQADSVKVTVGTTELHSLAVYGWTTARYALSVSGVQLLHGERSITAPAGDGVVTPTMPLSEQGAPKQRALPLPPNHYVYLPLILR